MNKFDQFIDLLNTVLLLLLFLLTLAPIFDVNFGVKVLKVSGTGAVSIACLVVGSILSFLLHIGQIHKIL